MIGSRVHHVSFPVSDLERARAFYEGVLGLEPIPRPEMSLGGEWYRIGDAEIHIIVTPEGADVGARPAGLTPLGPHTAFQIDDYAKTLEVVEARGVEVLKTSAENGQMWIRDPDGNVFELIEPRAR
jgi:catechol 2,3-dioxygenase-like lactoylglutathione lyase family enzyme